MLTQEQFDQLRNFTMGFLSDDPEALKLAEKSGLTASQLKVISVLIAYTIRAYDAMQSGAEFSLGDSE